MPKYKVDKKKKDSRRKDGPYDKESDRTWQKKRDENVDDAMMESGEEDDGGDGRGRGDRGGNKHHQVCL